jgi:hypothetical protein
VGHEGQVLLAAVPDLERLLRGERLDGRPDRPVEDAVEDVERPPADGEPVPLGEVVDAPAEDVVLGDDLLDVERVPDPLQAVGGRAGVEQGLRDRLVRPGPEGSGEFGEEVRDVVVERRGVEVPCRGERADLRPPPREERVPLVLDEPREYVEGVDGRLRSEGTPPQ